MCIEKGELLAKNLARRVRRHVGFFYRPAAEAKGTLRDAGNIFGIITLRRTWNTECLASERVRIIKNETCARRVRGEEILRKTGKINIHEEMYSCASVSILISCFRYTTGRNAYSCFYDCFPTCLQNHVDVLHGFSRRFHWHRGIREIQLLACEGRRN